MRSIGTEARKSLFAVAAAALIVLLLLMSVQPVSGHPILSGVPGSIPLDKETTITVTLELDGEESISIESVRLEILNSDNVPIATGSFAADGSIIQSGGIIVQVQLTSGSIVGDWGYGVNDEIDYAVTILLRSSEYTEGTDHGIVVTLFRAEGQSPMQSDIAAFSIGNEFPWLYVMVAIGILAVLIVLGAVYYLGRKK